MPPEGWRATSRQRRTAARHQHPGRSIADGRALRGRLATTLPESV